MVLGIVIGVVVGGTAVIGLGIWWLAKQFENED